MSKIGTFRLPIMTVSEPSTQEWTQEYYESVYNSIPEYVRPEDWLTLPELTEGDEAFVGLHAIFEDSNFVALSASGSYDVEWGDGTSGSYDANVVAYHQYNWSDFSGQTATSAGYKQAIVVVTPQDGETLHNVNLQIKHNQTGLQDNYVTGWLDIRIAGQSISSLNIGSSSTTVRHNILQQFEFVGSNIITDFSYMFDACYSLVKIVKLYTNSGINFNNMFSGCNCLTSTPQLDTSSGTSFGGMFNFCSSLINIPSLNLVNSVNSFALGMFGACYSLTNVLLNNYTDGTTATNRSLTLTNLKLSKLALENLFNSFGSPNVDTIAWARRIDISGNWGIDYVSITSITSTVGSTTVPVSNTSGLEVGMEVFHALSTGTAVANYAYQGFTALRTVTFSSANNNITFNSHGLPNGKQVSFPTATGNGVTRNLVYYVINSDTDTFQLSLTEGGDPITITGDGPLAMKALPVITNIDPNVSITLDIPAAASGTFTMSAGHLKRSIARLKGFRTNG